MSETIRSQATPRYRMLFSAAPLPLQQVGWCEIGIQSNIIALVRVLWMTNKIYLSHLPTHSPTYLPKNMPTYTLSYLPTHSPTHLPIHLPTYPITYPITNPLLLYGSILYCNQRSIFVDNIIVQHFTQASSNFNNSTQGQQGHLSSCSELVYSIKNFQAVHRFLSSHY